MQLIHLFVYTYNVLHAATTLRAEALRSSKIRRLGRSKGLCSQGSRQQAWTRVTWTSPLVQSLGINSCACTCMHVLRIRYNLFHRYWDLSTKIIVNKILTDSARSQSGARRTKFHREKLSFVQSVTRATKFHLWWMNVLKLTEENVTGKPLHKNPRALKNGRGKVCICLLGWRIYFGTRKQKFRSKNWTRCKLLERFLKRKDEARKTEEIPATEPNDTLANLSPPSALKMATSTSRLRHAACNHGVMDARWRLLSTK